MKYALLFLLLSFSISSFAQPIKSFNDSQSILTIIQFLNDSSEDLKTSFQISDKKLVFKDASKCISATSSDVINEVQKAINNILKFYPDEELPVEEAIADFSSYLEELPLQKCTFVQHLTGKDILISYYFDGLNNKHVKIDSVTAR